MNSVVVETEVKKTGLGRLLQKENEVINSMQSVVETETPQTGDITVVEELSVVNFTDKKNSKKTARMRVVKPVTFSQTEAFEAFRGGKNLFLHGMAGTGKTYVALYLGLDAVDTFKQSYDKLIIIRSVVPSRDMGYLPGSAEEKSKAYEEPYISTTNHLYRKGDSYLLLKQKDKLEFITTSYLRGITFEKCVVIVDEVQNMSYGELATIITRAGENCRFIFCGDFRQTDLEKKVDREGLYRFMSIIKRMEEHFLVVEFNVHDVVRSKMVKSFLTEEAEYVAESAKGFHN